IIIIGAGISGLCAGYELKRAGFEVEILEASSRVGGRVLTFADPHFAPGLHGEGGAMRIPKQHNLVHEYIKHFNMEGRLTPFEMGNKFIRLEGIKETMTYDEFNTMLGKEDEKLMHLFPGLHDKERGKTCDDLYDRAVKVVDSTLVAYYEEEVEYWKSKHPGEEVPPEVLLNALVEAYAEVIRLFDRFSLRTFLTEQAGWSEAAVTLFDLGNAHVVFENGFLESWKDGYLSSNKLGGNAGMEQFKDGMEEFPRAFASKDNLIDNIEFGTRATRIEEKDVTDSNPYPVWVTCKRLDCVDYIAKGDYLILTVPYTSLRMISKSRPFSPLKEAAIRQVRYVEVTKVLLQYKSCWWEDEFEKHKQGKGGGLVTDLPIRYALFPPSYEAEDDKDADSDTPSGQFLVKKSTRGVIMAAYTFERDATQLGALNPQHRISLAAENIHQCFPGAQSMRKLEAGASQVWPADEMAGGSAFCYFGPGQRVRYLEEMYRPEWNDHVHFAGEQASFSHGWIEGALEAGLRCAKSIFDKEQSSL
ncbi:amine oxidase, partial [Wilcoxina mikolae CBS 423.85]